MPASCDLVGHGQLCAWPPTAVSAQRRAPSSEPPAASPQQRALSSEKDLDVLSANGRVNPPRQFSDPYNSPRSDTQTRDVLSKQSQRPADVPRSGPEPPAPGAAPSQVSVITPEPHAAPRRVSAIMPGGHVTDDHTGNKPPDVRDH